MKLDFERMWEYLKEYKTNTIPTLEHNIDVLVENEDRLNNIIDELEKSINKEIERTNNLILEDSSMVEINTIRRMLNEDRQCWLFELKKLKGE